MKRSEIKAFLDEKAALYESQSFISDDPIQIPHQFHLKEDIEISAFLVATIAWGNRKSIISSGHKMMELMDQAPYDFIINHRPSDLKRFNNFVHRTFNGNDFVYFIKALRNIYKKHGGLEVVFAQQATPYDLQTAIHGFKNIFFSLPHPQR
ncbi:MAG: DUF2400 family protein, partial [Flavobacteriaceae bacterium]